MSLPIDVWCLSTGVSLDSFIAGVLEHELVRYFQLLALCK